MGHLSHEILVPTFRFLWRAPPGVPRRQSCRRNQCVTPYFRRSGQLRHCRLNFFTGLEGCRPSLSERGGAPYFRYTRSMCGIAGFVSVEPLPDNDTVLRRMTGAIAHRGPDDSGFFRDRHAALGHRRLSIIDIAGGHQPMPNETNSLWLIYNGEIFNHASLRPELEQAGH